METMAPQPAASGVISLLSCSSSVASQQGARIEPHIYARYIGLCPDIGKIKNLAVSFRRMITRQEEGQFEKWMTKHDA